MFVVDNNLSPKIARFLAKNFPGACHVADADLEDSDDRDVWIYAKAKWLSYPHQRSRFCSSTPAAGLPT